MEDIRGILRRMCAYDRDYRPTANDAHRDLKSCLDALGGDISQTLSTFAEEVVQPIYESRSRVRPSGVGTTGGENSLFQEISTQFTGSLNPDTGSVNWVPYLFLSGLTMTVVVLAVLAGVKFLVDRTEASLGPQTADAVVQDGLVDVKVWLPRDAQAAVDEQYVGASGRYRVRPGARIMRMNFDDGRQLRCNFTAVQGVAVRYVVESGQVGLSVDDEMAIPCSEQKAAAASVK